MPPDSSNGIFLDPDDVPPNRARTKSRGGVERLHPLPGAYVRVPVQWLCKPCRDHVFPPGARLFLYLLYRSHWGQRGVALTRAVIAEIGLSRSSRDKALARLELKGWVRIERRPGHALVVWPIVLAS